jgi:uncharacterized protein YndB with AHSA1/START domain
MVLTSSGSRIELGTSPETVIVSVMVSASPQETFRAVTDPARAGYWLGDLSRALTPDTTGERVRLDFGDGDFFLLDIDCVQPPHTLAYRWRFLGLAPEDSVSWRIDPSESGSRVTVTDVEAERSAEASLSLGEGWADFLRRLAEHLHTGAVSRYEWRAEIDGAVELRCAGTTAYERLLAPGARWLPLERGALFNDARVEKLKRVPRRSVEFTLRAEGWGCPTRCSLVLRPRQRDTVLVFRHDGWRGLRIGPDAQREARIRFAELWVGALDRAPKLVRDAGARTHAEAREPARIG